MTRVLVVHGSERGSTAEIAGWIGDRLRRDGCDAEVRAAGSVGDVTPYDAVVLGGALYAGRWHRDARRFVRRHARALRDRPVWLFSSGPLDRSADDADLPPVAHVVRACAAVDAREHRTFGGRLARDARGFIASRVAESAAGDYRDPERIRAWADEIAAELAAMSPAQGPVAAQPRCWNPSDGSRSLS
ncbi:flavodoxin domain-containing protein [Streptosporangium fragile]|uniref:Flavodoxin domain-containing protein n=1 Tax=Streptosporangium fragile TaxID=46186 RepID=A0ABP6IPG1_9ACTN